MNIEEILPNNTNVFYIPIATNLQKGIASFYEQHFDVVDGQVSIKRDYFANILTAENKKLSLKSDYKDYYLVNELYGLDGEVVSSSETRLPFDYYLRDINIRKQGNTVTFALSNETGVLAERNFNLSDYANKIVSSKNDNLVQFTLYNGDKVLSATDINLSEYANKFVATLEGNDITLDLRNNSSSLQSSTLSLSKYAKNINIVRNGDVLTFNLMNGNEILSTSNINITDSFNVKDCKLEFSLNTANYVMTAYLKDKDGTIISESSIDFPLESMVVDAYESNGTITLKLQNGKTISLYIGDLVDGLVSETLYNQDKSYLLNELRDIKAQLGSYVNTIDSLIGEVV